MVEKLSTLDYDTFEKQLKEKLINRTYLLYELSSFWNIDEGMLLIHQIPGINSELIEDATAYNRLYAEFRVIPIPKDFGE